MKSLFFLFRLNFLLVILSSFLTADIIGLIVDESEQPIENVLVKLEKNPEDESNLEVKTVLTDEKGIFFLPIKKTDIYFIKSLKSGYQSKTITYPANQDQEQKIQITLKKINVLETVNVRNTRNPRRSERESVSSTLIDKETIQNIKIDKVDDLSAVSASLLNVNTGSSITSFFSLRGISSVSTSDPLIGLYIDDIAQFQSYNFPIHLNNINSIEILKGPQLTFYGRNAMGGIIDIKTEKPIDRLSINASGDWGSYELQKYNVSLSIPIYRDIFFIKTGGFFNFFDGYFKNTTLNKNTGGEESYGTFLGTELYFRNFELKWGIKYERNEEEAFPYSKNKAESEANPYTVTHNLDNKNLKNTIDNFIKLKFPIDYFIFDSVTTYQYFDNKLLFDIDFGPEPGTDINLDFFSHLFTHEFKIKSTSLSSQLFSWSAGSYSYHQKRNITSRWRLANIPSEVKTIENSSGLALFGSITYPIINSIHLITGVRGDYDYRNSEIEKTTIENPINNKNKHNFNYAPKLGFNFYPAVNDLIIYISGTRGYRNGGINAFTSDEKKITYNSESSWNGELGLKYEFFGGKINTSVYYIYWKNQQVNEVIYKSGVLEFGIVNAGISHNIGYELETVSPRWLGFSLGGNFSYIHSRFLKFDLEDSTGEIKDISGNYQSYVPQISGAIFLEYQYDFEVLSVRDHFTVRTTLKHIGELYFDVFNKEKQAPYYLLDITSNFQIAGFIITLWTKNILDQRYYSVLFNTANEDLSPNKLGDRRSIGGKISFIF